MEYKNNNDDSVKRTASYGSSPSSPSSSTFNISVGKKTRTVRSKSGIAISIVAMAISLTLAFAAIGAADYSTSTNTSSILGNKVISDTSFTISNDGVRIATQSDVGTTAFPGPPLEMTDPHTLLRTNTITVGNFVYRVTLTEATALSSGTWNIYVYQDGVQIGQMVKVKQGSAVAGTTEGAIVLADLGSTYPSTNTGFEVRIVKS